MSQELTNATTSKSIKAVLIAPDIFLIIPLLSSGELEDYRVEKIKVELSVIPISLILKIIIKLQVMEPLKTQHGP